jgi:hypothetical protein
MFSQHQHQHQHQRRHLGVYSVVASAMCFGVLVLASCSDNDTLFAPAAAGPAFVTTAEPGTCPEGSRPRTIPEGNGGSRFGMRASDKNGNGWVCETIHIRGNRVGNPSYSDDVITTA